MYNSLFKLEQSIFLIKLFWYVQVWMMLVEALDLGRLPEQGRQKRPINDFGW
jgi:hypothetical protein